MLTKIIIQNIVLIEKLNLDFASGLCVLSGETGSGKSIVLDSLGLVIGDRANNRLLRQGCSQGFVVADFDISKNKICQEILAENALVNAENKNQLTLKRILFDNGTSKALANDIPVGINLLSQIGESLIEIHGQNEQRWLLGGAYQRQILDQFADNETLLKEISQKYWQWRELENNLTKLQEEKERNEREIDYLSHVAKELKAANVKSGEEEMLSEKRRFLNNREKIINLISESQKQISDADFALVSTQNNLIRNRHLGDVLGEELNGNFGKIIEIIDEINSKNSRIKDFIDEIHSNLTNNDSLEEIEERLFLIRNLSRKFNKPADDLEQFLAKTEEQLANILNYQNISENLAKNREKSKKEYLDLAFKLSAKRKESALKLSQKVEDELAYLKMGNVKFLVQIDDLEEKNYNEAGINSVRFLAKINQNSSFDQIAKIASGGELSRFMLALKVALFGVNSAPIVIFDEIDAGIGGAVAESVGNRLKLLAKNLQVIVVTHHAQVAAKSDYHLRVKKEDVKGATNTTVEILDQSAKEDEIARMLSGENISEEAKLAAKKLIG